MTGPEVVVIGAGVAGTNAVALSVGLGAQVTVLDPNIQRLRELDDDYAGRIFRVGHLGYFGEVDIITNIPPDQIATIEAATLIFRVPASSLPSHDSFSLPSATSMRDTKFS